MLIYQQHTGMGLTLAQFQRACPSAKAELYPHFAASLDLADATTPERVALYLTHTIYETAELRAFEERMSYSAEGLCKTWPHRFPTLEAAAPFARNPEALANHVYCDRLGNGDEASGDGWKFRGRGSLQVTGFRNYSDARRFLGIDLLAHPELAAQPQYAFKVGAFFWRSNGLNAHADARDLHESARIFHDLRDTTQIVNGSLATVPARQLVLGRVLAALGVLAA